MVLVFISIIIIQVVIKNFFTDFIVFNEYLFHSIRGNLINKGLRSTYRTFLKLLISFFKIRQNHMRDISFYSLL